MKTFIRSVTLAAMLLLAGSSFAQKAHPVTHHLVRHYKHHKKVYAKRGLPLPPPPGKLPSASAPGKLPAPPPPPKLPGLPHK